MPISIDNGVTTFTKNEPACTVTFSFSKDFGTSPSTMCKDLAEHQLQLIGLFVSKYLSIETVKVSLEGNSILVRSAQNFTILKESSDLTADEFVDIIGYSRVLSNHFLILAKTLKIPFYCVETSQYKFLEDKTNRTVLKIGYYSYGYIISRSATDLSVELCNDNPELIPFFNCFYVDKDFGDVYTYPLKLRYNNKDYITDGVNVLNLSDLIPEKDIQVRKAVKSKFGLFSH